MNEIRKTNRWMRLSVFGMVLTAAYVIGVPLFDLRDKLSSAIGDNFLDAQHNVTTFDTYLYFIAYLPVLVFASLWAYGTYKGLSSKHMKHNGSLIVLAVIIAIGSPILYFILDFCFGFYRHFTF